ncbi:MAG: glycoside hydrolase family 92 protein, partial [Xanthomonadales bacterium]|nr:glycoside hydrolase family 92 protein [Xanthomonadales bacterium]
PFLERVAMNLPNGKRFTIVAENLDDAHPYIGSVTLDGKPLDRSFIRHEEIMAGGDLHFTMQAEPNRQWATDAKARPYSMSTRR